MFRIGSAALLNGMQDPSEKFCLIGLAFAARATVGYEAVDGLPARRFRGLRVAGGLFQVVQGVPGIPGFSDMTERLVARNRPVQFAAGLVVTS